MGERPVGAGPWRTAPVVALKTDPWQGQAKTSFVPSNWTVQPAWGQTAEKARKAPFDTWMTSAGTWVAGSVKLAAPPTGTSVAGPISVPFGVGPVVTVVDVVALGGVDVAGLDEGAAPPGAGPRVVGGTGPARSGAARLLPSVPARGVAAPRC